MVVKKDLLVVWKDEDKEAILQALQNPRWRFRTTSGIASEAKLPEALVKQFLLDATESTPGVKPLVRRSPLTDRQGRILYTLNSRPRDVKEKFASLRAVFDPSMDIEQVDRE